MKFPTSHEIYQAMLLQAADGGRDELLFGNSMNRVRAILPDFFSSDSYPALYLEYPLKGDPFLDLLVMYDRFSVRDLEVRSPAAEGTREMLEWFADAVETYQEICCGYELDTSAGVLPAAGVYFQPRRQVSLAGPFFASIGEEKWTSLYLKTEERLWPFWPISYFGLFRGRPDSPMRIGGYLNREERTACAGDPERIRRIFEKIGFTAINSVMIRQIAKLLSVISENADFQLDLYPDSSLGSVFAIDIGFKLKPAGEMILSFLQGENRDVMNLLEEWGIVDSRWKESILMAFTRGFEVKTDDERTLRCTMLMLPEWIKVRWIDGRLQPAKIYTMARAGR